MSASANLGGGSIGSLGADMGSNIANIENSLNWCKLPRFNTG